MPARAASVVLSVLRFVLLIAGLALLLLALFKVSAFENFRDAVLSHGLVPKDFVLIASGIAVGGELLVAIAAVWGALGGAGRGAWGAAALTLILLSFLGYATALVVNPPPAPVSCGCTPNGAKIESWAPVMSRNAWLTTGSSAVTLGFLWDARSQPGRANNV
jgi:hypothetical protein